MKPSDTIHTDSFDRSAAAAEETMKKTPEETLETPETGSDSPEIDEKELKIQTLENELNATRDQLYRRAADYENLRKRADRERVQVFQSARIDAIKQFLAINDDLTRTLQASTSMDVQPAAFLEGVQMIASKFQQVLAAYNVTVIADVQVPFDVNFHDAMMRQPAPEGVGSNIVVQVVEAGYRMGESVIRHAKVIVTE